MQDVLNDIAVLIAEGSIEMALDNLRKSTAEIAQDPEALFKSFGLLIECGARLRDAVLIEEGIEGYKNYLGEDTDHDLMIEAAYNSGLGYLNLFELESTKAGVLSPPDHPHLQSSKDLLRTVLKERDTLSHAFLAQVLTNYGSCLNYLGRSIEALEAYDEALKYQPDLGLTLGNKAMTLHGLSVLGGHYRSQFLLEAREMLVTALAPFENDTNAGPDVGLDLFRAHLEQIDQELASPSEFVDALKVPEIPPGIAGRDAVPSRFTDFYYEFCLEHGLFLNLCLYCNKCPVSETDPLIVTVKREGGSVKRFVTYVNQIKEDYATARFLLAESQYDRPEVGAISDSTTFADRHGRLIGIKTGLLKMSLEKSFNILDKVAIFVRDYFKMPLKVNKAYFLSHDLWKERYPDHWGLRKQFAQAQNPSLFAIYDIYRDLFEYRDFRKIKHLRNAITHYFLVVENVPFKEERREEGIFYIDHESLVEETIRTMKLVKAVIFYLFNFIAIEESRKPDEHLDA